MRDGRNRAECDETATNGEVEPANWSEHLMGGYTELHPDGNCQRCPVKTKGLCAPLLPDQMRFLETLSTGKHLYPAGSELFGQGELCSSYFTIMEGWAFTYVLLEQGSRQILDFALPGEFLGFQSDPAHPMAYSAQCPSMPRRA